MFLDLGSNRGLQVRKLYEPETFPLAPVLPLYQKYFGKPEDRNLQEICSVSQLTQCRNRRIIQSGILIDRLIFESICPWQNLVLVEIEQIEDRTEVS